MSGCIATACHWFIWYMSVLLNVLAWCKTPSVWNGLGHEHVIDTPAKYVFALGHVGFGALTSLFFLVACCPPNLKVWSTPRTVSWSTTAGATAFGLSMVSMLVWFSLISASVSGYPLLIIFVASAIPMLAWSAIQINYSNLLKMLPPKPVIFNVQTYCQALCCTMNVLCDAVKNRATQEFDTVCNILIRLNTTTYYGVLAPIWIWVVVTGFGVAPGIDHAHHCPFGNLILGLLHADSFESLATNGCLYGFIQILAMLIVPIPVLCVMYGSNGSASDVIKDDQLEEQRLLP